MPIARERAPIPASLKRDQLPPRVNPKTFEVFRTGITLGLFDNLDTQLRNLVFEYILNDISSLDLARENKISKTTVLTKIKKALEEVWRNLPADVQNAYSLTEILKIKDPHAFSPSTREKKRKLAIDLWRDPNYRDKTTRAIKRRRWDPQFIEKMRQIRKGRPPERHNNAETSRRISKGVKESWKFRANNISKDDRDAWDYANAFNLLPIMQQGGFLTDEDIQILRDVFENRIIGKSAQTTLNKFSIALVKTV